MSDIILSSEQIQILNRSSGLVTAVDASGTVVGQIARRWFTPEQIAAAERRIDDDEPCFTTAEVLDHLRSLEQ